MSTPNPYQKIFDALEPHWDVAEGDLNAFILSYANMPEDRTKVTKEHQQKAAAITGAILELAASTLASMPKHVLVPLVAQTAERLMKHGDENHKAVAKEIARQLLEAVGGRIPGYAIRAPRNNPHTDGRVPLTRRFGRRRR